MFYEIMQNVTNHCLQVMKIISMYENTVVLNKQPLNFAFFAVKIQNGHQNGPKMQVSAAGGMEAQSSGEIIMINV